MTFDEIKAAVLGLSETQQIDLLCAMGNALVSDDMLSIEQKLDLLVRIREHELHPEDTEDGEVVMARLKAKYQSHASAT